MNITISALLPVRNGAKYLPECIKGIEANSAFLSQILVVDDGSSDATPQMLKEWSRENDKVEIFTTQGIGLIAALNLGIKNCSGDFVARFDVDDLYAANRIDQQSKIITSETVAVFSDYEIFSNDMQRGLGGFPSPVLPYATSISLIKNRRTPHPTALISRRAFDAVGGYREQDFLVEDLSLWLRLSRVGELVSVPQSLLQYRISESSVSLNNREEMQKRRALLLEEIKVHISDYVLGLEQVENTLASYRNLEAPNLRGILFLHELSLAGSSLSRSEGTKISRMIFRQGLQPVGAIEYLKYLQQAAKRIRYRRKLTSGIS